MGHAAERFPPVRPDASSGKGVERLPNKALSRLLGIAPGACAGDDLSHLLDVRGRCRVIAPPVSYTHLTLPTIYTV